MSELIPYGGLGCQGSAPMPFVKQRRRRWLDGLPSRSMGRRGRRSGDRPMQRAAGAPGACLRVTSGPPFHHAAMVLPAQTPRQGRLPASLRDGLRPALTRTLVQQIGSAMRNGRGASRHAGTGSPDPGHRLLEEQCGRAGVPPRCPLSSSGGAGWLR